MASGGWQPLRPPRRPRADGHASPPSGRRPATSTASPFSRLAVTYAFHVAGDTLVTMALAGSLFFSISPSAARGRVALYLLLTMAPFAVVAPFLGPALDRSRSGRRLMLFGALVARAVACVLMADDLKSLLLFPEAFVVLVSSKTTAIAKSALVPSTVEDEGEFVEANSKLALVSVAMGLVAAVPGVILLNVFDARWVLRLAAVAFAVGAFASLRMPSVDVAPPADERERAELRATTMVLAASAMALLRVTVGFLTFLIAFAFRRDAEPSWWFGVALAASMAGNLCGNAVAPRLRQDVSEERMLTSSLIAIAVAGLLAARDGGLGWIALLAFTMGTAAAAAKLAFDSLVQRDAPDAVRGRSFARFETRFQLAWVAGAVLPVVIPIPARVGFLLLAGAAVFAAVSYVGGRRAAEHRHAAPRHPA